VGDIKHFKLSLRDKYDEIKIDSHELPQTIRYSKHKALNTETRYENKYLLFNHAE